MPVKWGIIGAGGFADKRPLPALKNAKGCEITALMDIDLKRAESLAAKYGAARFYDNVDELVKDESVQAVYIATPVPLHREHTEKAASAGKHILCEKPMAATSGDCSKIIAICKENRVKLMVGMMLRFHSYHRKIKEMIEEGLLGEIIKARTQLYLWYPEVPGAWRQDYSLSKGGCMMDVGVHCLDLLRFLLGDVKEVVSSSVDNFAFSYLVEDSAAVILKFQNGSQGIIDVAWCIPHRENLLEIYGTKGSIIAERTIGPFTNPEMKLITEKGEEKLDIPYVNTYQAEFEHFAQCIRDDREPLATGEDGLANIRVIEDIYKKGILKGMSP